MIRKDNREEMLLNVDHLTNKQDIRIFIIHTWLKESIGKKYRYFVETLSDDNRIYLERPANLNKGCDFVIYAENYYKFKNKNDKPPPHKKLFSIFDELKQSYSAEQLIDFFDLVTKVHQCENIFVENHSYLNMELELPLKLVKWFFIEQDVTYWNYNGRDMLYDGIKKYFGR